MSSELSGLDYRIGADLTEQQFGDFKNRLYLTVDDTKFVSRRDNDKRHITVALDVAGPKLDAYAALIKEAITKTLKEMLGRNVPVTAINHA